MWYKEYSNLSLRPFTPYQTYQLTSTYSFSFSILNDSALYFQHHLLPIPYSMILIPSTAPNPTLWLIKLFWLIFENHKDLLF